MVPFILALFRQLGANRCNEPAFIGENYVGYHTTGGLDGRGRPSHDGIGQNRERAGAGMHLYGRTRPVRRHTVGDDRNLINRGDLSRS